MLLPTLAVLPTLGWAGEPWRLQDVLPTGPTLMSAGSSVWLRGTLAPFDLEVRRP